MADLFETHYVATHPVQQRAEVLALVASATEVRTDGVEPPGAGACRGPPLIHLESNYPRKTRTPYRIPSKLRTLPGTRRDRLHPGASPSPDRARILFVDGGAASRCALMEKRLRGSPFSTSAFLSVPRGSEEGETSYPAS
jgi:hypothetical protein